MTRILELSHGMTELRALEKFRLAELPEQKAPDIGQFRLPLVEPMP